MDSLGSVTFPEDAVGSETVLGALRWGDPGQLSSFIH